MAMLPSTFKAQDHETMDDFSPLPVSDDEGKPIEYTGQIVKSEIKDTKAGNGKRLNMQVKIMAGDYKDRIIFIGLNIVNPSDIAVEISMKELRSISDACGVGVVEDTQVLHMKPFGFNLKLVPASDSFPAKNEICKYIKLEGTESPNEDPFGEEG